MSYVTLRCVRANSVDKIVIRSKKFLSRHPKQFFLNKSFKIIYSYFSILFLDSIKYVNFKIVWPLLQRIILSDAMQQSYDGLPQEKD